jgi:hypothetical protein
MTTPRGPAPGPAAPPDLLRDVLDLASREGALQGEGLAAFVEALRERARLVLVERAERLRALEAETERLAGELGKASDAHDALLAHHRELLERVATELVSIAALSPLRARQARRRLRTLAGLLRVDSR